MSRAQEKSIETPEELEAALCNLITALAAACVSGGVEVIERAMACGAIDSGEIVGALAASLDADASARSRFSSDFTEVMRRELEFRFGIDAGEVLMSCFLPCIAKGDLRAILASAAPISRQLQLPLKSYLKAHDETWNRQTRMINAIAEEGMEGIAAFGFADKLSGSRRDEKAALDELRLSGASFSGARTSKEKK